MTVKALKAFAGVVTMSAGDVRDVSDEVGKDLMGAGYVEAVGSKTKTVAAEKSEGKSSTKKTAASK